MSSFRESGIPSCNSLLESTKSATFCHKTFQLINVPVYRLDALLARVPTGYNFYYLKIDVEGADFLVLQGGDYIDRFEMVSIECRAGQNFGNRVGECDQVKAIAYMKRKGFLYNSCDATDCNFYKREDQAETVRQLFMSAHHGKQESKYCSGPKAKEFFTIKRGKRAGKIRNSR
jgi:hypothetical protein